jgi:hypothetical protein
VVRSFASVWGTVVIFCEQYRSYKSKKILNNEELIDSKEQQGSMELVMSYCLIYVLHCLKPSASCRPIALLYPCLGRDAVRIERLHPESPSERRERNES